MVLTAFKQISLYNLANKICYELLLCYKNQIVGHYINACQRIESQIDILKPNACTIIRKCFD